MQFPDEKVKQDWEDVAQNSEIQLHSYKSVAM